MKALLLLALVFRCLLAQAAEAQLICTAKAQDRAVLSSIGVPGYESRTNTLTVLLDECDSKFESDTVRHACFLGPTPYRFMLLVRRLGPATLFYADESLDLDCAE